MPAAGTRISILVLAAGPIVGCGSPAQVQTAESRVGGPDDGLTIHYMTAAEALRVVFPDAARIVEEDVLLAPEERAAVEGILHARLGQPAFKVYAGIASDGTLDGFAVIQAEIGKFKLFHFIVGVEPDGRVRRVAVLTYRESRGGEVAQRRFVVQYEDKTAADPIRTSRDIINISGATMSVNSMNHGVKKVLAVIDVVYRKNPERIRGLLARPPASPVEEPHPSSGEAAGEVREARYIMGSLCEIRALGASPEELRRAIFRAFLEVEAADRCLSDYRPESELSAISRAAGLAAVQVSGLTVEFLDTAARLSAASRGAFDITVGPLVDAWGFHGSPAPAMPAEGALDALRSLVGHDKVRMERCADGGECVRLDRPGMRLDPGALGKGFAVDLAVRSLRAGGVRSALIDFSGNMYAIGAPPGAEGWPVAVRDPARPDATLVTILLRDRAISSSGSYGTTVDVGGARRGHILSPWTLRPAEGVLGATVIAASAAWADGWSTAACVLGEDAPALLQSDEGTEALIVLDGGGGLPRAVSTAGWTRLREGTGLATGVAPVGPPGRAEEPHSAAGPRGEAYLAWGEVGADGQADILLSRREGAWLPPVRLNPVSGSAVAGRQVGPRIAVAPGGAVLVSWVDRGRDPAGDIVLARSEDGGRTFESPSRRNDDAGRAGQEYQDIAVSPRGRVLLVWLDERDAPAESPNEKQVQCAVSEDGGRTFGPNRRVTSSPRGVCPCCRPTAVAAPGGSLHVAYRDRDGDHLVTRVVTLEPGEEGFRAPVTVSSAWGFDACPVDAPTLLSGRDAGLRVAWMDGSAGKERIWQAVSLDGGASFGPARPLALVGEGGAEDAVPGRAVLARHPELGALAAWEDSLGRIWARALEQPSSTLLVAGPEEGPARSPTLAVLGADVLVSWVETVFDTESVAAGRLPTARLRHAVLHAGDRLLTMERSAGESTARP